MNPLKASLVLGRKPMLRRSMLSVKHTLWLCVCVCVLTVMLFDSVCIAWTPACTPNAVLACRLRDEEAAPLVDIFTALWAAQTAQGKRIDDAASDPVALIPKMASSASPNKSPAGSSSSSTKGQASRPDAKGAASEGSATAAKAREPSQRGTAAAGTAADVAGGVSSMNLADQGRCLLC